MVLYVFIVLLFLLLHEFRRSNYLLWSWRAMSKWEHPHIACLGLIFLAQGLFLAWMPAASLLSLCWRVPLERRRDWWRGDQSPHEYWAGPPLCCSLVQSCQGQGLLPSCWSGALESHFCAVFLICGVQLVGLELFHREKSHWAFLWGRASELFLSTECTVLSPITCCAAHKIHCCLPSPWPCCSLGNADNQPWHPSSIVVKKSSVQTQGSQVLRLDPDLLWELWRRLGPAQSCSGQTRPNRPNRRSTHCPFRCPGGSQFTKPAPGGTGQRGS